MTRGYIVLVLRKVQQSSFSSGRTLKPTEDCKQRAKKASFFYNESSKADPLEIRIKDT